MNYKFNKSYTYLDVDFPSWSVFACIGCVVSAASFASVRLPDDVRYADVVRGDAQHGSDVANHLFFVEELVGVEYESRGQNHGGRCLDVYDAASSDHNPQVLLVALEVVGADGLQI